MPVERFYELWSSMLGWQDLPAFQDLPKEGMGLDYLRRDVMESIAGVHDEIPIYPGIGLDMPTPARTTEPEDVSSELITIYEAGARGVVLSRALGEMQDKNLRASGETIARIQKTINETKVSV